MPRSSIADRLARVLIYFSCGLVVSLCRGNRGGDGRDGSAAREAGIAIPEWLANAFNRSTTPRSSCRREIECGRDQCFTSRSSMRMRLCASSRRGSNLSACVRWRCAIGRCQSSSCATAPADIVRECKIRVVGDHAIIARRHASPRSDARSWARRFAESCTNARRADTFDRLRTRAARRARIRGSRRRSRNALKCSSALWNAVSASCLDSALLGTFGPAECGTRLCLESSLMTADCRGECAGVVAVVAAAALTEREDAGAAGTDAGVFPSRGARARGARS